MKDSGAVIPKHCPSTVHTAGKTFVYFSCPIVACHLLLSLKSNQGHAPPSALPKAQVNKNDGQTGIPCSDKVVHSPLANKSQGVQAPFPQLPPRHHNQMNGNW